MRIWVYTGILVVLAILALIGDRVMIDVKPDVTRPTMTPAIRADIAALEARLMPHVRMLGGTIGKRYLARPNERRAAAEYIRKTWTDQGFTARTEAFQVDGRPCENLIIELRGVGRSQEIVLIGAHYDTAPGTPGANDNGSGVALLLEMSRAFTQAPLQRTLRFVAFTNEEPPHFFTEDMGSRVHARKARLGTGGSDQWGTHSRLTSHRRRRPNTPRATRPVSRPAKPAWMPLACSTI